jgi:formylglycine-generating enzyme required for sulfatase activity
VTDIITDIQIQPLEASLRLSWGMVIEQGRLRWGNRPLEARLFCKPLIELGETSLYGLPGKPVLDSGLDIGVTVGFVSVSGSKAGEAEPFRAGMRMQTALDEIYYPLHLDFKKADLPENSKAIYVVVDWQVLTADYLKQPFELRLELGYRRGKSFDEAYITEFKHTPDGTSKTVVLPDVPQVAQKDRVQRRSATPSLFISYSHANSQQIGTIAKRLSAERYYDVWIDYDSIPGGSQWQAEISRGIQHADVVLFMMSPESCASDYCRAEIQHALKYHKRIIPVRINSKCEPSELERVGLSAGYQFIDYTSSDDEENWRRLVTDASMPEVLPRDKRLLDPVKKRLHQRYLRTFFKDSFLMISLSDMVEDPPKRGVPLTDIYVPLPVDMSVTITVDETDMQTITGWWVKTERSETRADEAVPEEMRERKLHEWPALKVGHDKLEMLIGDVQRKLIERAPDLKPDDFRAEQNWYMEALDAAAVQPRMVLTGNPGSGKTVFLKHLALCLAGDQLRHSRYADVALEALDFWPYPAYTPIFISLRDLVGEQFPKVTDTASTVQFEAYLQDQLAQEGIADYWETLQEQLEEGSAIILLDGLDEVPDAVTEERRDQIIRFIQSLDIDYHACRIVITSRPYAYNGDWQLDGFGQTALKPLHNHRVWQLTQMLFKQVLPAERVQEEAEAFFKRLRAGIQEDMRNTPLLFTLMATLWLRNDQRPEHERLPQNVSALYRASVNLMLERWTRKGAADAPSVAEMLDLTTEQLRAALELTAYNVQREYGSDQQTTFRQWDLVEAMEIARGNQAMRQYQEALDYLEQRAGLLTSEEARLYRFAHLSFQEHLAACELAKPDKFPEAVVQNVQRQPGRWRNVVPLLADDIAARRNGDLLRLFQSLLPDVDPQTLEADDVRWELIAQAGQLLETHKLRLSTDEETRLRGLLARLVSVGALAPVERAEMGRLLSTLSDPRFGVGTSNHVGVRIPEIDWVTIPAGDFIYSEGEAQQTMPLQAFQISRYPITYAQFQCFLDDPEGYNNQQINWFEGLAANEDDRRMREQKFKYSNHPRENVNWYQAMAFCRWLSWRLGGDYSLDTVATWKVRLPTEYEWEKAARGTDGRVYPWGPDFDAQKCNSSDTGINQTSAVGMFPSGASPYDAFDMSGNVWEWCLTEHSSPQVQIEHEIITNSNTRVLRGGSFFNIAILLRAPYRVRDYPVNEYFGLGLRCARSYEQ